MPSGTFPRLDVFALQLRQREAQVLSAKMDRVMLAV
jgi:hypothetical protein